MLARAQGRGERCAQDRATGVSGAGRPLLQRYVDEAEPGGVAGQRAGALEPPPPADDTALARRIVRAARWQRAVREPLGAAARLIAAVADGVLLVASGGQRRNRP